jgi:hypothetical protein
MAWRALPFYSQRFVDSTWCDTRRLGLTLNTATALGISGGVMPGPGGSAAAGAGGARPAGTWPARCLNSAPIRQHARCESPRERCASLSRPRQVLASESARNYRQEEIMLAKAPPGTAACPARGHSRIRRGSVMPALRPRSTPKTTSGPTETNRPAPPPMPSSLPGRNSDGQR